MYQLTDLIMISPEVYKLTLNDFGQTFMALDLVSLSIQIYLISSLLIPSKPNGFSHVRVFIVCLALEWSILAIAFYPFYFSELAWYWPWATGLCLTQLAILGLNAFKKIAIFESRIHIIACLLGFLIVEAVTIATYSEFAAPIFVYGPIQVAFLNLILSSILKPSLTTIAMIPLPVLVIGHELLLMSGR